MANQITKSELSQILANTDATEIIVSTRGEVKMNKTNNPFYEKQGRSWVAKDLVEKCQTSEYSFGGNYEERVNEALVADGSAGTFEAAALTWGEWEIEGKVITHNGKLYVRCYIVEGSGQNVATTYFVNGEVATEEQVKTIKEFTPTHKPSAKQSNEGLEQGKQIIPNNIDFDKIVCISIGGEVYEIKK